VLPFVGYYVYKLISSNSPSGSVRRVIAAGAGAYVGICVAALSAGIEFGLQPLLYHTANGQALYCPYGLNVAVPAMVLGHLVVFGWVEVIVTALVVKYLQKQDSVFFEGGRS
jgi:cobalt/nickel transport system permease protein